MTTELRVPEVGESISEALIVEWLKDEGDYIEADEEVVVIETDKANFEVPSPVAGTIEEIKKRKDDWVEIGEVIASIDEDGKPSGKKKGEGNGETGKERKSTEKEVDDDSGGESEKKNGNDSGKSSSDEKGKEVSEEKESPPQPLPAARRLLSEHDIDASRVEGSGKGGRILKENVLKYLEEEEEPEDSREKKPSMEVSGREEESIPMSPLRRTVAQRLVDAQREAALLTTFNEIDMSAILELRKTYGESFQAKHGVKLGFLSFFVRASVEALKRYPEVNAEVREKDIVYHNYYDIGIAVSGKKGLLVPVLRNAERLSFSQIEKAIRDFAERAQDHEISLEELEGGTFTISNGGVFGSLLSTPIVNPPQSGVLGLHAIGDRPVVRGGEIAIRPMMYVALTYDHRVVDGREAVTFLRHIKQNIEQPSRILLEI